MSVAIHDRRSRITPSTNMDTIEDSTPQLVSERTSAPDVLIKDNPSLYTTYSDNKLVEKHQIRTGTFLYYNKRFYYRLVPDIDNPKTICLLNSSSYHPDNLYYAIDRYVKDRNGSHILDDNNKPKIVKSYIALRDRADFYLWYYSIPEIDRVLYEIITSYCKSYFDIDGELIDGITYVELVTIASQTLNHLQDAIASVMADYNIPYNPKSLLIYSSHGPNKRSYHVVIRHWYHNNFHEARAFYDLVMAKIGNKCSPFVNIDSSVYSQRRAFRLLGSHKLGNNRTKIVQTANFEPEYTVLDTFFESMVSVTTGCSPLPSFLPSSDAHITQEHRFIGSHDEESIVVIFNKTAFSSFYTPTSTDKDWLISLRRIRRGFCSLHNREHDHVGGNIRVYNNGAVIFQCLAGSKYGNDPSQPTTIIGHISKIDNSQLEDQQLLNTQYNNFINNKSIRAWINTKVTRLTGKTPDLQIPTSIPNVNKSENVSESCLYIGGFNVKTCELHTDKCYWPVENNIELAALECQPNIQQRQPAKQSAALSGQRAKAIIQKSDNQVVLQCQPQQLQPAKAIINNKILDIVGATINNNTIPNNEIVRRLRMATQEDFITFLTSSGCPDPTYHKLSDCYVQYCNYCRNNTLIPQSLPATTIPVITSNIAISAVAPTMITPDVATHAIVTHPVSTKLDITTAPVINKRSATSDDIALFLEALRVPNNKAKVSCPKLYPEFRNYCNSNNLICDYQARRFTDNIKKLTNISLVVIEKVYYVLGISIDPIGKENSSLIIFSSSLRISSIQPTKLTEQSINAINHTKIADADSFPLLDLMANNSNNNIIEPTHIHNNNYRLSVVVNATFLHDCPINKDKINNADFPQCINSGSVLDRPTNKNTLLNNNLTPTKPSTIEDLDNFYASEFVKDDPNRLPTKIVVEAFTNYCQRNNLLQSLNGMKLINTMADKYRIPILFDDPNRYLCGYKLRYDPREVHDREAADGYYRIWHNWTDPYRLGWKNGPYPYRLVGQDWDNIDITYSHALPLIPIKDMVEDSDDFVLILSSGCGSGKTEGFRPFIEESDRTNAEKRIDPDHINRRRQYLLGTLNGKDHEHMVSDDKSTRTEQMSDELKGINNIQEDEEDEEEFNEELLEMTMESINNYPNDRIVICVNRKSLTNKFYKEYRNLGFTIRNDDNKGEMITDKRVAICYPSLYTVLGKIDTFVMDEYCSTMKLQFSITKKKRECFKMLKARLQTTPRVIIADAGLRNRHILDIKRMCKRRVTVHQCLAKTQTGKIIYRIERKGVLIKRTLQAIREGKRIAVPSSSKKYAKTLYNKIRREMPWVNVGIYTADEMSKIKEDPAVLWSMSKLAHQVIIYTCTIQCGNSFIEQMDAVYGYFLTSTSDHQDIMQMLLRCRNLRNINICLETKGFREKIIPDDVAAKIGPIKKYIMSRQVIARRHLESKSYKLPMDMLERNPVTGELNPNGTYLNMYCGYIKDLVQQQRECNFLLMLALRDQGMMFGKYVGRMEYDEEAKRLEDEFRQNIKDLKEDDDVGTAKMENINDGEAKILETKHRTPEESRTLRKYKLKKEYGIPITPNVVKFTKGLHSKHNNLTRFMRVSGIEDETQRQRIMGEIGNEILKSKHNINIDDTVGTINETNLLLRVMMCFHALNILKILGLTNFIDNMTIIEAREINEGMRKILDDYIQSHLDDMRHILSETEEFISDDNNSLDICVKIVEKAFGLKIKPTDECKAITMASPWVKYGEMIIPKVSNPEKDVEVVGEGTALNKRKGLTLTLNRPT